MKIYAYLNTHHREKFYEAVTTGGHKQMKIEFVKHARHGGSKDFDVNIKDTNKQVFTPCQEVSCTSFGTSHGHCNLLN